jgi:hypothetical protein
VTDTTDHPSRRAGLRDELRRAVCEAEGFVWDSDMLEPDEYGDHADTVLAVLYREWPWLRAEAEDAVSAVVPAADRAAVLRETADRLVEEIQRGFLGHRDVRLAGWCESVGLLRQWAAEVAAVPVVGVAADTTPAETEAHPPEHAWKVESPRRDNWASWGATYDDCDWAQERYESATANAPARAFRLVRATTTYTVEAEHRPTQPGNDTKTPVGYRSRDGRALYCTRHTGEIFGFGWRPVDSDDLPDGGICTYPDCGADVVIPQQPKEA